MDTTKPRDVSSRNKLISRIISATIMIPVAVLAILVGKWPFILLVTGVTLFMNFEWIRMVEGKHRSITGSPTHFSTSFIALCVLTIVTLALVAFNRDYLAIATALAGGMALWALQAAAQAGKGAKAWWTVFPVLYIILPAAALIWIRTDQISGLGLTMLLFLTVWITDSAAYLGGKTLGGPKLKPDISPRKTWAGTLIGIAMGGVGGAICGTLFSLGSPFIFALVGIGLAVASVIGDIVESAMKRGFNVKDSGNLIPGHGGLLDRLDGMIFATAAMGLTLAVYRFANSLGTNTIP